MFWLPGPVLSDSAVDMLVVVPEPTCSSKILIADYTKVGFSNTRVFFRLVFGISRLRLGFGLGFGLGFRFRFRFGFWSSFPVDSGSYFGLLCYSTGMLFLLAHDDAKQNFTQTA